MLSIKATSIHISRFIADAVAIGLLLFLRCVLCLLELVRSVNIAAVMTPG